MVKNNLLTEKQKTVLKLYSQGKKITEITETTGFNRNTVDYALKSGQKRLDNIIETIRFAVENKLLNETQVVELEKILTDMRLGSR